MSQSFSFIRIYVNTLIFRLTSVLSLKVSDTL